MSKLNFTADTIETTNNKNINIVSSTDTDSTYPSSKAVYDSLNELNNTLTESIETLGESLSGSINDLGISMNSALEAKGTITTNISENSLTDDTYPSTKAVYDAIKNLEKTENKHTGIITDNNATDDTYPSSKAVYDSINLTKPGYWVDQLGITDGWFYRQWDRTGGSACHGPAEYWITIDKSFQTNSYNLPWTVDGAKVVTSYRYVPFPVTSSSEIPKIYCSVAKSATSTGIASCMVADVDSTGCFIMVFGPAATEVDVNVYAYFSSGYHEAHEI